MSEIGRDKKYDVAISFRWPNLEHARALYELLRDRLDVFFADERFEEFVGTDGEESFGHIFRDQTRIAVIFYSSDWGSTPFTRAEEAAIKQRGFHEGYGFTVWIPMEHTKSPPPYVPPQNIWFDFATYGVQGLAAVVEARVRDSGKEVIPESITDRLKRSTRRAESAKTRKEFINSQDCVQFVEEESSRLESLIADRTQLFSAINPNVVFKPTEERGKVAVDSWPFQAAFYFRGQAKNSASSAEMHVHLNIIQGDMPPRYEWSALSKHSYKPTMDDSGVPSWMGKTDQYLSLEAIVESVLDELAEKAFQVFEERAAKW